MAVQASPYIKVIDCESAGVIQLNRPEALNAINLEMSRYFFNDSISTVNNRCEYL